MTLRDVLIGTLAFIVIVAIGLAVILSVDEPEPDLLVQAAVAPTVDPPRHTGVLQLDSPTALSDIMPPERYQDDVGAAGVFSHQAIRVACPKAAIACVKVLKDGTPILFVPNPCPLAGQELYATILCHEIGHLNGWRLEHGE